MMLTNLAIEPAPSIQVVKPHEYSADDVHGFFRRALLDPDVGGWCVNTHWDESSVTEYANEKLSDSARSDRTWIAVLNGEVIGYISIEDLSLDGIGRVYGLAIAVCKQHHGKGVGTVLIQKILSVARLHRMDIHCITLPINKAMQALLVKNGFHKLSQTVEWSRIAWYCYTYSYSPIQQFDENGKPDSTRASYR